MRLLTRKGCQTVSRLSDCKAWLQEVLSAYSTRHYDAALQRLQFGAVAGGCKTDPDRSIVFQHLAEVWNTLLKAYANAARPQLQQRLQLAAQALNGM